MTKCKHCDAGLPTTTLMFGDVPVPGIHKVPCGGGNAEIVPRKNFRVEVSQKALAEARNSPFWSMIKKDETFK